MGAGRGGNGGGKELDYERIICRRGQRGGEGRRRGGRKQRGVNPIRAPIRPSVKWSISLSVGLGTGRAES